MKRVDARPDKDQAVPAIQNDASMRAMPASIKPQRRSRSALSPLSLAVKSRCASGREDGQGDDDRGDQGEGLGVGQRLEQLALGRLHGEDRQEADDRRGHGGQHGAADLARRRGR